MKREGKSAFIEDLKTQIQGADATFLIRTNALSVLKFNSLRSKLRANQAKVKVGKARLVKRALVGVGAQEDFLKTVNGQIAVVISKNDSTTVAKSIFDFKNENEGALELVSGIFQGKSYDSAGFEALAKIPSKEVLYGMLAGVLAQNIARVARALSEVVKVKTT